MACAVKPCLLRLFAGTLIMIVSCYTTESKSHIRSIASPLTLTLLHPSGYYLSCCKQCIIEGNHERRPGACLLRFADQLLLSDPPSICVKFQIFEIRIRILFLCFYSLCFILFYIQGVCVKYVSIFRIKRSEKVLLIR